MVIELYNINGQYLGTVYQGNAKELFHSIELDVSNLTDGVYFYKVKIGNLIKSVKFTKL